VSLVPSEAMDGDESSSELLVLAGPLLGILLALVAMVVLALA